MKRLALALGVVSLGGCSLALSQYFAPTQLNECVVDAECGSDAKCVNFGVDVQGDDVNACAATKVELSGLILEVIPPGTVLGANPSYLVPASELGVILQGTSETGIVSTADIQLPALVAVQPGTVYLDASYDGVYGCVEQDGSFPAAIELRRRPPASAADLSLGPELAKSYTATSEHTVDEMGEPTYRFDLAVPPGDYDLYVIPLGCNDGVPPPPPLFYPLQKIDSTTAVNITVPAHKLLSGTLLPPAGTDLRGYVIEVLEPGSARALSAPTPLVFDGQQLTFEVAFSWADPSYVPIVRVRPPTGGGDPTCAAACGEGYVCSAFDASCLVAGACMVDEDCDVGHACIGATSVPGACVVGGRPSVHYSLEALALTGSTENIALDMSTLAFDVREVSGQLVDAFGQPVVGTVELRSTKLDGSAPNVTFAINVDTDVEGVFDTWIPPGTYRAVGRPLFDSTKAIAQRDLEVAPGATCFCGQSIEIPDRITLTGMCSAWEGGEVGQAQAVASPVVVEVPYFMGTLALAPVAPREAETVLGVTGALSLPVDPGAFDLSIRPNSNTYLPWLVRPRLTVQTADAGKESDLGDLTIGAPVFLRGSVVDGAGVGVSGAIIRAWLPVEDEGGKKRAVLVGETTSADAAYLLPLPTQVPH